jgi:SAM-dependent methyltransferase
VNRYSSKEYWTHLARDFARDDEKGFAPVLHPGAPDWFNEAIDRLQAKAWNRALDRCALGKNAQVLDVGCGTGRWVRRLGQRELSAVGIDQSLSMLRLAQERGTHSPLFVGMVQNLPFRDESFDCVSGITVVQHILASEQEHALREMIRVLRPGGYLILFELIRGQGPHVFSRKPADWISQVSAMGPRSILWFGQEFLLFDRLMVALLQSLRALAGYAASETLPGKSQDTRDHTGLGLLARRIYWALRKISVVTSVWIEPVAEKICPKSLATHGVFLFQKVKAIG